ncbi:hypothetical protein SprV_0200962000 [Sparganum proliferum]
MQMKCQSLRNEANRLKQAQETLSSRRKTAKRTRKKLSKDIISASNDLLSACRIAFSRAQGLLDQIQSQADMQLNAELDNQKLIKLAVNILWAIKHPAQYWDAQRLCGLIKVALDAADTLSTVESSEARNDSSPFGKFALAESLQTIGARLGNMHLLTGSKSSESETGMNLKGNSQSQVTYAPKLSANLKAFESTVNHCTALIALGHSPQGPSSKSTGSVRRTEQQDDKTVESKKVRTTAAPELFGFYVTCHPVIQHI